MSIYAYNEIETSKLIDFFSLAAMQLNSPFLIHRLSNQPREPVKMSRPWRIR
ncbi:hypothetical protein MTO98_01895 [Mucilaginibacter sp. SMC90]|uniref:hypothetical protein n=1 Tax=Mucilaginibacter TaxID=423349 RepID=UPI00131D8BB2|nr:MULTISPECIES: hypothetical protein [unclassified Mucilaginibacter]MBS7565715.1 hypothetical protein [Mucilaginibacter sp. Bleaf8]UOE49822.1 hypothetical protein MTO98_01895 [Mucilaginibacter sp. SMC90]